MKKTNLKKNTWTIEAKILVVLTLLFGGVIAGAWGFASHLQETIAASNAVTQVDLRALIDIEKLRNTAESQISNSRSFFLLGSTVIFEEAKKDRKNFSESLASFEKKYSSNEVREITKNIDSLQQQLQEVFDQGMKFREQRTESKIVGQFYQSKIVPIRTKLNQYLDEIVVLQNAELDRARAKAHEAAAGAEVQVPKGMTLFTGLITFLFLSMILLVVRLLGTRKKQVSERNRLFDEAQKAVKSRDEVVAAVSYDLNAPLKTITEVADQLRKPEAASDIMTSASVIRNAVADAEGAIKNINDQSKSDAGQLTLRLDQLEIDHLFDDARLMLQGSAKQRDIRLQFDSVNPPVLAFFDRERVMRVLSNLVGNAIKFSPKHSKVVVKVRSDQQFVYISVADNGPGIPENQQPGLFDNFWQARQTADQGAGVGLAVVKTIIQAHGGTIRVDSRPGQGSTFTFSLPRRRPVGAQLGKPAPSFKHSLPRKTFTEDSPEL